VPEAWRGPSSAEVRPPGNSANGHAVRRPARRAGAASPQLSHGSSMLPLVVLRIRKREQTVAETGEARRGVRFKGCGGSAVDGFDEPDALKAAGCHPSSTGLKLISADRPCKRKMGGA